jgi:hypothetical protein
MANSSGGIGEVLPIVLLAGAAWFIYETFFSTTTVAATTPAVPATPTTTTTTPPVATTNIVIPAGFTVTPDINNSWKGTVTYNGSPATFNLIYSGGAPTGQVFSSAGADVTATLGSANVTALVNAFQNASNVFIAQGGNVPAGMGQYVPIRVPHAIMPRRTVPVPVRRRMEAV